MDPMTIGPDPIGQLLMVAAVVLGILLNILGLYGRER